VRCADFGRVVAGERQDEVVSVNRYLLGALAKDEPHALLGQDAAHGLRDVVVLAGGDVVRGADDNRHVAAHAAVELGHLEAYVAAADDSQVTGKFLPVEPIARLDVVHPLQTLYRGDERARAGVQDHLPDQEGAVTDAHAEATVLPAFQAGVAPDQERVLRVFEALVEAGALRLGHAPRPAQHRREVDADLGDLDPILGSPPGLEGHLGGGDRGLGRAAPEVHARAAQVLALGQSYRAALRGELVGQRDAGLPPADDQDVVIRSVCQGWSLSFGSIVLREIS
jgi:hypothetical protein